MHVDHAVDAFMRVLHLDPVDHGAKVVAEMQIVRWLHAGKDAKCRSSHSLFPKIRAAYACKTAASEAAITVWKACRKLQDFYPNNLAADDDRHTPSPCTRPAPMT